MRKVVERLPATDPDWGTLIAVVAWTGCRRGEVCALWWEDVDLGGKSILIHRSVVAVPGGVEEKGTKTGEVRRLAMGPRTVKLLKAHQKRSEARAKACDNSIKPASYVFSPDPAGRRPYNPTTIARASSRRRPKRPGFLE